jgi:hypothetical protein
MSRIDICRAEVTLLNPHYKAIPIPMSDGTAKGERSKLEGGPERK